MLHPLADGAVDIIGDVHGEYDALRELLYRLGYAEDGSHRGGRRLVFVGDLIDRGPDSTGVVEHVRRMVDAGRAQAILGNHELNLLRGQRKDGNDWFWGEGSQHDTRYAPFSTFPEHQRQDLLAFLGQLPLALEREDLRIVHAAWHDPSLDRLRTGPSTSPLSELFEHWEQEAVRQLAHDGILQRSEEEKLRWAYALRDPGQNVPLLENTGRCDEVRQMGNPIRVLTSGLERLGSEPFFSSGEWRFAERVRWWDEYTHPTPVVVGHYWRRFVPADRARVGKGDPDLFETIRPDSWHGARGNVFCVDFSVGGRYQERRDRLPTGSTTKLAALRWPERTLFLDTGEEYPTRGFHHEQQP